MIALAELISVLRERRIRVWEENGELRVSAPRNVLTKELTETLKTRKAELLEFLREARPALAVEPSIARGPADRPRPLSLPQERLWLLERLGRAGAAYNLPGVVRVTGALDEAAMERAFDAVQRRHDVLRARFIEIDGAPVQIVREERAALRVVAWDGRREGDALTAIQTAAAQPFDVTRDPLVRGELYRLDRTHHVLAVTFHHLICDGLSLAIFIAEVTDNYRAITTGANVSLPPLTFQYADFAEAQRARVADSRLDRNLAYWREALSDAPAALELPVDRARPDVPSLRGDVSPIRIPEKTTAALRQMANDAGVTPFMVLLSAYAVALGRAAAQDDIVVGVPIADRTITGTEELIGLFVNALPLRVQEIESGSFLSLVERVKTSVLGAMAHSDVPWDEILETLQPQRDPTRPPVFQAAFAYQDDPARALHISGLTFEPLVVATGAAKFELSLELHLEAGGDIAGGLEFNTDLFDASTIDGFVARYLRLLNDVVRTPEAPLAHQELLSASEQAAVLALSAGPKVFFALERNLPCALAARVDRHPERPAVVTHDRVLTFGELDAHARTLASALLDAGLQSGEVVAVVADRTPETIAGIFAVLIAGGAYMPVDPSWPDRRIQDVMTRAGCRALLAHARWRSRWSEASLPVVIYEDRLASSATSGAAPVGTRQWPDPKSDDPAYVLFTSGSTGVPKGVIVEQRSVLHLIAALEEAVYRPLGLDDQSRVSVNGALTFDTSVKQIFQLLQGRPLVLIPEDVRLDGAALLEYTDRTGVSVLDATPSQLALLADAGLGTRSGSIRSVFSGGEALSARLWARLRGPHAPRLVNLYGPTECTVDATAHVLDVDDHTPRLGRPLPNIDVMVLDRAGRLAPIGTPGEIVIGGPGVARGYIGDDEGTRARFIPNPFSPKRSPRLYRTGDRGRLLANGQFEFLGRLDHQIKLRGHRIELTEIERALEQHPAVRSACALVIGESETQRRLVACAAVDPLRSPTVDGRRRYRLPNGLAIAQLNPNETNFLYDEMFERNAYLRHGVSIRDGDVLVDVGSNIGMFALSMHVRRERLRIVCVEPNPHVRRILSENLRLFGADAKVFDCGVATSEGTAEFTFYPGFSILSGVHADTDADKAVVRSYIRREQGGDAAPDEDVEQVLDLKFQSVKIPVRLRPLGDLIAECGLSRIDLLKINVEKAELEALLGVRREQWSLIRQVTLEVHDVDERLAITSQLLRDHGFDVTAEEDWSLEHGAATNYYIYAVKPERRIEIAALVEPSAQREADRLRQLTPAFVTPDELEADLDTRLPDYMRPSGLLVVDRLPLTAHGKVDRRKLATYAWEPDHLEDEPLTLTTEESLLAGHWRAVLDIESIRAIDHFFRIGGHSLSAVRLASRLSQAFGFPVSVTDVFEYPVLRDMAGHLATRVDRGAMAPISRRTPGEPLVLSYAQERLLFLEHLEGGGRAYVIAGAAELNGVLDDAAFRRAFQTVADRHAVLRSAFSVDDGQARVTIVDALPVLDEEDWTGTTDAHSEAALRAWMERRAAEPFDLAEGRPVRAALLRLSPATHILFVSFHHLVADGWSIALFLQELSAAYRAHVDQTELPAIPARDYYDYAAWQRHWLSGAQLASGLEYWKSALAGASPFLDLPTDRPRPAFNAYRGATLTFDLPADLRARVDRAARELDATPFMFLLGVFGLLLHRWTGQTDIVIGSPSAGRSAPGTDDLIGLFVNMLILRLGMDEAETFRGLMSNVRRTTRDALAHEDIPFERIVDALRPPRLLNRHPIFQVLFALQNVPAQRLDLPGVTWAPVPVDAPTGRFDLELVIDEVASGYHVALDYSADLFDAATIARVAAQYQTLLAAVLADPDAAIATVDFLDADALARLRALNPPVAEPEPFVSALAMVARQARAHASDAALTYRGTTVTYGELRQRIGHLAAELRRAGVRPRDVVAIYTDRSPAWVVGVLSVLDVHAVFLPIDPDYPIERVRYMLEDSGATLVITQTSLQAGVISCAARVLLINELDELDHLDEASGHDIEPSVEPLPDAPAYLIYTSGSTGQPKGALNAHRGLANLARRFAEIFDTSTSRRVLHFASIGFDASVAELVTALAAGGCLCLADREEMLPGAPLAHILTSQRITHVTLPPSVLAGMTDTSFPDLAVLIVAGEACPIEVIHRWAPGRRFFNNYGPTEAAVCATVAECQASDERVTIGRPLPGVSVYVVDPARQAVPPGIVGEICIGGVGLAIGYWRRDALTREVFVEADPDRRGERHRVYRTGDRGRFSSDGSIEFLGRLDRQIKLRGFRIELGEIEAVLRTHPAIRDCAVVLQAPDREQPRLVAFVVDTTPGQQDPSSLKEFLRTRLPDYMVPAVFASVDGLPLTPNAKLDRRALERRPATPRTLPSALPAATDAAASEVAAIFAEVLGRPNFGLRDDFFEHGGHSLLAAQVMARVRERLHTDLTLRTLFEAPTPRALAARVADAAPGGTPPIVATRRFDDRARLSSAQRRLWFLEQLDGAHAAYNLVAAARLRGPLDLAAFATAVRALSDRHEVLRTSYPSVDGEPVVRLSHAGAALRIVDVEGETADDRWRAALEAARVENGRPFTLSEGPLFRPVLYRLGPEDFLFLAAMHHIVSDGWSIGVLVREVSALYAAARDGRPFPAAPAVQYGDYAAWFESPHRQQAEARELGFWKDRLAGAPARLELPTDRPRPPMQTFNGGTFRFTFGAATTAALRATARASDATPFMTLLAAFTGFLSRYSGQLDVLIGTPIANRTRPELESLIGLFVNTVVIRSAIDPGESFRSLVSHVRQTSLDAFARAETPFETIVDAIRPERHLSHAPLVQVMFAMTASLERAAPVSGLVIEPISLDSPGAKFDLTLFVDESDRELTATFEYNADLFETNTIERMAENFQAFLSSLVRDPGLPVGSAPIIGSADRALLHVWNATAAPAPAKTVCDLFEACAVREPDAVAVEWNGGTLSYGALDRRANQVAHYLRARGVVRESLIALFLDRSPDLIVALLGVLKAGGAYLPLDVKYPPARLSFMLQDSGAAFVLTKTALEPQLAHTATPAICLDREAHAIDSCLDEALGSTTTPRSLAYVIYTSGSTGVPKGVLIEHRGLTNYLVWAAREYRIDEGRGAPVISSISFDATITSILGPLVSGQRLVLLPEGHEVEALADPNVVGVDRTFYKITPAHLDALHALRPDASLAGRVRRLVVGGEALLGATLSPWSASAPDVIVTNEYGPTETVVGCTSFSVPAGAIAAGPVPIGRPIANTLIRLVDEHEQAVPVGVTGEIWIGGHGVARGYHGRPDLSAERFVERAAPELGQDAPIRWYRTGDQARWTGDGQLIFLGRRDGQVKLRGHRIELGEIEAVARRDDDVLQAVAVIRSNGHRDSEIVLFVVGRPELDLDVVRATLRSALPAIMVPNDLRQLEALPLTPNGKVDRDALIEMELTAPREAPTRSRDHVRDVLASLWASLLGSAPDNPESDFFASGGHSLLAARLSAKIREAFGVELSLRTILERPTWDGLADAVASSRRAARPALPPITKSEAPRLLSFGQQRLWAIEHLESPGSAYHVASAFRLTGPLDLDALEGAIRDVTRRHDVLRSAFPAEGGRPSLQLTDELPRLRVLDLRDLSGDVRESMAAERVERFLVEPFDLSRGHLLRAALYQLEDDVWIFAIVLHHIVSDGWSSAILATEITERYAARSSAASGATHLSPLPFQYADYAAWQRRLLSGDTLDRVTNYWKAMLLGAPPRLDLPLSGSRPAMQTYRGAVREFRLSQNLRQRIADFARDQGATPYMVLLTAYAILLSRWSGQTELVVGTPMANRSHSGTEGLIGFFVNTLPLRLQVERGTTVRALVHHVRDQVLGAFDHQDLPFERLVEILNPPRNPAVAPIFQVLFSFQQTDDVALRLPGVTVSSEPLPHDSAKFDLTLAIDEHDGVLDAFLEYAADLFDDRTIDDAIERYVMILTTLVDGADQLDDVASVTMRDRAQLAAWNDTAVEYGETRLIHEIIQEQAQRTPNAVALEFDGQPLSYAELEARSAELARELQRAGVGADVLVGVCLERSFDLLITVLGILKAGGAYVPLDPEYPAARLGAMIEDARLQALVTRRTLLDRGVLGDHPNVPHIIDLEGRRWNEADTRRASDEVVASTPAKDEDLAYVIFTSGSTGRPKGVMIEHRSVRNRLLWMQDRYRLTSGDVVLQKTPVSFDVSVWELFWPLMYGARLVIARPGGHRDAAYLTRLIAETGVTTLHFVPSMLQIFLEEPGVRQLPSLRQVFCSGEALPAEVVQRFMQRISCPLHNLYGPTEAAVDVTAWECRIDDIGASVPIGRPIANTRIHILDESQHLVPVGVPGELYIGGVNLARGYVNRPDLTAERFVSNPFAATDDAESACLYRTGDLARWRTDGQIEFLGRLDAQVKLRGFRIELGEIETALMQHPDVREAAAAVVAGPGQGRLVGYIVARGMDMPPAESLRAHLQERLPEYMVPTVFVRLDQLPLGATGKLDRRALPTPAAPADPSGDAPATATEQMLADIWRDLLNVEAVHRHQNFFELGGDSLLAIQMAAQAKRAGIDVSARLVLEHQTIATLSAAAVAERTITAEQGLLTGEMPIAPIVSWFFEHRLLTPAHFNQAVLLSTPPDLDAAIARSAVRLLVEQHDALRLRWNGDFSSSSLVFGPIDDAYTFETISIASLTADQQQHVIETTTAARQASLDPTAGLLSRVVYFEAGAGERGRLFWVSHHLAVDAVSWTILMDDLDRVMRALISERAVVMPAKTSSWREWAQGWEAAAREGQLDADKAFWLSMPRSPRLPSAITASSHDRSAIVQTIDRTFSRRLTSGLPRESDTTVQSVLLAALWFAWSNVMGQTTLGVDVEGHGRNEPATDFDVSRTLGWFTAVYPIVLADDGAADSDSFDRVAHVHAQISSVPRGGTAFGVLKYLARDPEIAALPASSVLFNYLGDLDRGVESRALFQPASESVGPTAAEDNELPYAAEVVVSMTDGQLHLHWRSRAGALGADRLQRLADATRETLEQWAQRTTDRATRISPSRSRNDFRVAIARMAANGYAPLVRIREHAGADGSPLFLVHPGGGTVLCYRDLATRLDVGCYGLQAPGLANGEQPIESVEALAEAYVQAVLAVCPSAPLRLGGWSFGGIVAFEMARQLRAAGRAIDFVTILDVHAPGALPASDWEKPSARLLEEIFGEDAGVTADDLRGLSLDEQLDEVTRRAVAAGVFPAGFSVAESRRAWDVFQTHRRAERRYEGGPLDADVLLVTSANRLSEGDPSLGWTRLARRLTIHPVAGNHQQILRLPVVDDVAKWLTRRVLAETR